MITHRFRSAVRGVCAWLGLTLVLGCATASAQLPGLARYDLDDPPQGLFAEEWMEIRLGGQKMGYGQVTLRREADAIHARTFNRFLIARGPARVELSVEEITRETLAGQVLSFRHTFTMAGQPVISAGRVRDGVLEYELRQGDYILRDTVPYPQGALMSWGLIRQSYAHGFEPGKHYTLSIFSPDLSYKQGIPVHIEMGEWQQVTHRGKALRALPVTSRLQVSGTEIISESLVDEDGRTFRSVTEMMGLPVEFLLVSQEEALADFTPVEMLVSQLVEVNQRIPPAAREVRYILRHTSGRWPEGSLPPATAAQSVHLDIDDGSLIIDVQRMNPAALQPSSASRDLADDRFAEYLQPNLMIDSADEVVRALVIEAVGEDAAADWQTATALRRFVADYIEDKNLDVGFASASEVARNPQGDCTEHAVLLAAMGRAAGIPSRVAMGLWYLPWFEGREHVMGYHMWTQFYLAGHWLDVDAAGPADIANPTRIALGVSSLKDESLSTLGLGLMDQMGQLQVEVADIRLAAD